MAENNQAEDRYNPPGNLSEDFQKFTFGELEMDELFWQTNQRRFSRVLDEVSHFRQCKPIII